MAQWRIKEISNLTKISVRMLRYYDKIGLLKPSVRGSNGYRLYSVSDLASLQQIIALRFFDFDLGQIKIMLQQKPRIREHLLLQQQILKEQAEHLNKIQDAIAVIIDNDLELADPLDWNKLIALIGRYRMAEEIKKTWAGKLNDQQFAQYLELRMEFPQEFNDYDEAVELINRGNLGSPEGQDGERMVKIFLDLSHKMKKIASRLRVFNADLLRSIKEGKLSKFSITPEGNLWLEKALLSYQLKLFDQRYQDIVQHLDTDPAGPAGKRIVEEWRNAVAETFMGMPWELVIGLLYWQEMGRKQASLKTQTKPLSYEEQVKEIYVPLFFNPQAMSWIEKAFIAHSQE